MSLVQTAAPGSEPITLAEAKLYLRIATGTTTDDDIITSLITTAREHVEAKTGLQLMTADWKYSFSLFPGRGGNNLIRLPKPPIQSVLSIKYLNWQDNTITVDSGDYQTHAELIPYVEPVPNGNWPDNSLVSQKFDAVEINIRSGYTAASAVPADIKIAMKQIIRYWYEARMSCPEETAGSEHFGVTHGPFSADTLLAGHDYLTILRD